MNWYELSYKAFLNQPIQTKDDLIRILAYAYSWMPTIPDINSNTVDWDRLIKLANELRHGDINNRKELVTALIPIVNNSIVGSSKVLHFIAPDTIPIIDSRVTIAWNKRCTSGYPGYNFRLPRSYHFNGEAALNRLVDVYLAYWDAMRNLSITTGRTIRELEFDLYSAGKSRKFDRILYF